jgi:hypothetical protein
VDLLGAPPYGASCPGSSTVHHRFSLNFLLGPIGKIRGLQNDPSLKAFEVTFVFWTRVIQSIYGISLRIVDPRYFYAINKIIDK